MISRLWMDFVTWHGVTSGWEVWVYFFFPFFIHLASEISHRVTCISCFQNNNGNFDEKKTASTFPQPARYTFVLCNIYIFTMTLRTRSPLSSLTLPAMPNASGMLSSPS